MRRTRGTQKKNWLEKPWNSLVNEEELSRNSMGTSWEMTGKCGEKSEEKSRPVKLNEPIMIMGEFRLNVMKRDFGDLVRECGDLPF